MNRVFYIGAIDDLVADFRPIFVQVFFGRCPITVGIFPYQKIFDAVVEFIVFQNTQLDDPGSIYPAREEFISVVIVEGA